MAGGNHNPNLDLSDIPTIQKIFDLYYDVLKRENKNPDALNFNLALYYKHRGTLLSKIYKEEERVAQPLSMDPLFEKAVEHYRKVSSSYLDQITEITVRQNWYNQIQQKIRRKYLFLYPDHFQKVFNNRDLATKYFTDKYIIFLLRRGYFSSLYKTSNDLALINNWLSNYFERKSNNDVMNYSARLQEQVLLQIDSLLSNNPSAAMLNNNIVRLLLINYYIDNQREDRIDEFYKKLEPEKFPENLKENITSQNDFYFLINRVAGHLVREGRIDEVTRIARIFPNSVNRINTYSLASRQLLAEGGGQQQNVFLLLDSAISELNRIKSFEFTFDQNTGYNDPRKALILALSWVGGQEMHNLAGKYVEQISMTRQNDVLAQWIEGTAASGKYYLAYASIPDISSAAARINYFNRILLQESIRRPMEKEWKSAIESRLDVYAWEFLGYEADNF
jgi:hypothetical protein